MQWVIKRHAGFTETIRGLVHSNGVQKLWPEKAASKMAYMNVFKKSKIYGNVLQDKEII